MVTATTAITELLTVAALGSATYYLVFRENTKTKEKDEVKEEPVNEGILGLHGLGSAPPTFQPQQAVVPTGLQIDTVGVNITDYLDSVDSATLLVDKQTRLEEELKFAADSLQDIDMCDGMLVVDVAGDVIWCEGDLVGDTSKLGNIAKRIRMGRLQTMDVLDNKSVPFFNPEVRSVALLAIGEQGAALAIGSRQKEFFGELEKRVATAVCNRLANFLYKAPEVE